MVPFDPSNSILQICSDRIVRDHFILRILFLSLILPESNQNVRPLKNDPGRIHEKLVSAIDQTVSLRRSDAHKLDRDIFSLSCTETVTLLSIVFGTNLSTRLD